MNSEQTLILSLFHSHVASQDLSFIHVLSEDLCLSRMINVTEAHQMAHMFCLQKLNFYSCL